MPGPQRWDQARRNYQQQRAARQIGVVDTSPAAILKAHVRQRRLRAQALEAMRREGRIS